MALLEFVLILLLQAEAGISGGSIDLYNKPGDEVVLPCNTDSSFRCSDVDWLYNRAVNSVTEEKVKKGKVNENSAGAARLSVNSDCSLIINNITDEDVGRYTCRLWDSTDLDSTVYLNILTISPSPPDADLQKDEVTLTCSLLKQTHIGVCGQNSIRWLDDEGTILLGKGDGYEFRGQTGCVSHLTVKHQRDHNRRFTCQFVERNIVKIEAHYPPHSTDTQDIGSKQNNTTIIIIGATVGVMMLLFFIITAVLIKYRRRPKKTKIRKITTNVQTPADQDDETEKNVTYATVDHCYSLVSSEIKDETEKNVTYATVDHSHPKVSSKIKVKEEEDVVTYSAVRTKTKAEVDNDPSSYYSCVNLAE